MFEFTFPDVGEGLEEGEVLAWLVSPGEVVRRDQPLVEVQTDKATVELPSPVAGRVSHLEAAAGDLIKVGQLLVVIEDSPAAAADPPPSASDPVAPSPARPKAAPSVRKLAAELGVGLAAVTGTGPGGRILVADVEDAHRGPVAPSRPPVSSGSLQPVAGRHPLRGIRRVTAETMTRSWSEIPHITLMDEVDVTALLDARRHLTGALAAPVSLTVLFVAAVARSLRRHPVLNASLDMEAGEVVVHDGCHVGVAVATANGLVVPVVRHADRRSLPDLASEVQRLTAASRDGNVERADLTGGTFTVSNYGAIGGRFATPLIRPPEVGIMGFGTVRPRPVVVDGTVAARPTLPYCCSADHRLVDGDLLAAFSEDVARALAEPVSLLANWLTAG